VRKKKEEEEEDERNEFFMIVSLKRNYERKRRRNMILFCDPFIHAFIENNLLEFFFLVIKYSNNCYDLQCRNSSEYSFICRLIINTL
jgi:hypothetical protein